LKFQAIAEKTAKNYRGLGVTFLPHHVHGITNEKEPRCYYTITSLVLVSLS